MVIELINQFCVSLVFVFICGLTSYGYIPNTLGKSVMIVLAIVLLINHRKFYR